MTNIVVCVSALKKKRLIVEQILLSRDTESSIVQNGGPFEQLISCDNDVVTVGNETSVEQHLSSDIESSEILSLATNSADATPKHACFQDKIKGL